MGKILQQFSSSNWKFAGGRGNLRQTAFPVYFLISLNSILFACLGFLVLIVVFPMVSMQFLFVFEYSDPEEPDSTFKGACSKLKFYQSFTTVSSLGAAYLG